MRSRKLTHSRSTFGTPSRWIRSHQLPKTSLRKPGSCALTNFRYIWSETEHLDKNTLHDTGSSKVFIRSLRWYCFTRVSGTCRSPLANFASPSLTPTLGPSESWICHFFLSVLGVVWRRCTRRAADIVLVCLVFSVPRCKMQLANENLLAGHWHRWCHDSPTSLFAFVEKRRCVYCNVQQATWR